AKAQDDVTPALATRRAVVELADLGAELRLFGELRDDPRLGEPIQAAELLLAEAFVDHVNERAPSGEARCVHHERGRLHGTEVRRREHDRGALGLRPPREPAAERARLPLAER